MCPATQMSDIYWYSKQVSCNIYTLYDGKGFVMICDSCEEAGECQVLVCDGSMWDIVQTLQGGFSSAVEVDAEFLCRDYIVISKVCKTCVWIRL